MIKQTNKIKPNQKSNCYTSECAAVRSVMFLARVEKPVNYYIKIQDLDNYIIQLYILKYVGSMKQISQLPDKNKEVVQRFGFFAFCCPVLLRCRDVTAGRKPNS